MTTFYKRGCTAVDKHHEVVAESVNRIEGFWWWICGTCNGVTQGGMRGLRAHCRVIHTQLQVTGQPKEEQEWTPRTSSSSTESRSHLMAVSSSTTGDSPETPARTD